MPGAKIWTGTLSFVLVSIPVELVSALRYNYISFRMMHKKDNAFLERRMFCPKHEKYVPYEHVINGYEVEKDKYVIVRQEEYESLEPKRSQSIEIEMFVDPDEIGAIYLDRPYYILPRKGGQKSYEMLRRAMYETNKAGIAKVVFHEREHLVMVRANKDVIELVTLHYANQIRDKNQILPHQKAQAAQVKSITHQIEKAKGKYQPDKYIDDYKKQVLEYLEEKIKKGKTVTVQEEEEFQESEEQAQGDLVSALEESLAKIKNK